MKNAFKTLALPAFVLFAPIIANADVADKWPSSWGPEPVEKPIAIVADTVLDGTGKTLHHATIVVTHGKIERLGGPIPADATVYNLKNVTVTPGLIDTHSHIFYHFRNGRFVDNRLVGQDEPVPESVLYTEENGVDTLNAGFTTVQKPGPITAWDTAVRAAWNRNIVPGPRLLTGMAWFRYDLPGDVVPSDDVLREQVRQRKASGADFIKIFASKSAREGGVPTLNQDQLNTICGEAHKIGLRTLVHSYKEAVKMAVQAGCTTIEHGSGGMTDEVMAMMVERGTFYDPTVGVVGENYVWNESKYVGIGNYTEEAFKSMNRSAENPKPPAEFMHALTVKGLKITFGTDATAGAHGHNAEGLIYEVNVGHMDPMRALVSATSVSAESLGLGDQIGTITAGKQADIIAMGGDFLKDAAAARNIVFVMKGGKVFKYVPYPAHP